MCGDSLICVRVMEEVSSDKKGKRDIIQECQFCNDYSLPEVTRTSLLSVIFYLSNMIFLEGLVLELE